MKVNVKANWKSFAAGVAAGALGVASAAALAQSTPLSDEMRLLLRRFSDSFAAIKQNFAGEISEPKMVDGCLGGMLRSLDGQSDYLSPAEFREMRDGATVSRAGIGLELANAPNGIRVVAPIEGSPAERVGVVPGDLLIKIDDAQLAGMALAEAVKLLRGASGSKVRVTVVRANSPTPVELSLVREIIRAREVRARMLEAGTGYVRISQFRDDTPQALARALLSLQSDNGGSLRGVVLDLRNNPGGLFHSGIAVAATFLRDDQLVLSMQGRSEDANRSYFATPKDFSRRGEADFRARLNQELRSVPLVVLVNRGSAAASELVAAALQDHGRARIVGERTFGRGSIQTILPLVDGSALKLTTAYWHSPVGRALHGGGVQPDVAIEPDSATVPPAALGGPDDPGVLRAARLLAAR
jgi:carboxyl-terminal processing protease